AAVDSLVRQVMGFVEYVTGFGRRGQKHAARAFVVGSQAEIGEYEIVVGDDDVRGLQSLPRSQERTTLQMRATTIATATGGGGDQPPAVVVDRLRRAIEIAVPAAVFQLGEQ